MTLFTEDEKSSSLLPIGIAVTYKMSTETEIVHGGGVGGAGVGATLVTFHKLVFARKD